MINMPLDYLSAFIIGLLGSGHCIGMCGGISSLLTSAIPGEKPKASLVLGYNLGRILSYSLIGAIVGFTSSIAVRNIGVPVIGLRLISGVFLVLLGLYIGQWLMWISKLEKFGQFIWRYLSPLSKQILPVDSTNKAILLGAIWGWLPCGLVYSTLTWALASNSAFSGAFIMFCFGLGTLPALLTVSFGFFNIKNILKNTYFRKALALVTILYGIFTISFAYRQLF
ncbi:sulfite exporter TauE/SafE family protein [Thalassotalea sp. PLHSN55]|uniref:sulfite exporter TauE/SafE family protein n=1 Tax=Thalassotalea sp. PLHSN55 TaxID=3435888 RepID=UPI003F86D3C0